MNNSINLTGPLDFKDRTKVRVHVEDRFDALYDEVEALEELVGLVLFGQDRCIVR